MSYCWWLKSSTTWHVNNPGNNGINYVSTGAGFLPSSGSWNGGWGMVFVFLAKQIVRVARIKRIKDLSKKISHLYDAFLLHVASQRPNSSSVLDFSMAQLGWFLFHWNGKVTKCYQNRTLPIYKARDSENIYLKDHPIFNNATFCPPSFTFNIKEKPQQKSWPHILLEVISCLLQKKR